MKNIIISFFEELKKCLPFAIVDSDPQNYFARMMCYNTLTEAVKAKERFILVKEGVYYDNVVDNVNDVLIIGSPSAVFFGESNHGMRITNSDNVVLVGMSFKTESGKGNSYDGLYISETTNIKLFGCRFPTSDRYGLHFASSSNNHNAIIMGCHAPAGAHDDEGFYIAAQGCTIMGNNTGKFQAASAGTDHVIVGNLTNTLTVTTAERTFVAANGYTGTATLTAPGILAANNKSM